ncbi:alpha-amylase family glycosyl hydrolase [uncultured Jatrophihabitans sp.]|uniref:alpha-amylase family glycosyl hydrolase n=1 Tax=uncultured Jatrophihabitans sp. TaxID=1610747 RepID=UPI0035CC01E9
MPDDAPAWVDHVIWWHVYPLGFTGADTTGVDRTPVPRLDHLVAWLDDAVELGVNGLALGPVFTSSSHGYDTIDHLHVDPRLGGDDAFARLVDAARARGLRIMLDGVFNHVGPEFVGLDGDRAGWLRRERDGSPATFEGHDGLLALDHDNPDVAAYVTEVMTHWLEAGADAWRLDAAYAVPPQFWPGVLSRVRAAHPGTYVLGEMLHGDYAEYVERSGLDSVTQYELWKAVWSSLSDANFFELDWTLQRHNQLLDSFVPYTFVGNHDVTRIATAIADERHQGHATALLLTLAGTPAIYYGDEQGLNGRKEERVGGDDAVRPAFPAEPQELPAAAAEVRRVHQQLIGVRRRHPWLHIARSETVTLTNETLVLTLAGKSTLTLALNLADDALVFEASGSVLAGAADPRGDGRWEVPGHGWALVG